MTREPTLIGMHVGHVCRRDHPGELTEGVHLGEANARDPRTGFQRVTESWQPSKAPPPPPGFDPRDRTIGRPHG